LYDLGPQVDLELVPAYERLVDLPALGRYVRMPLSSLCYSWLRDRWIPAYGCRSGLITHMASGGLELIPQDPAIPLLDDFGWLGVPGHHSPESRDRALCKFHQRLLAACPGFSSDYQVWPGARQALAELVKSCHEEKIPVIIVRMPEESCLRRWYAPNMESKFAGLIADLRHGYGRRCVDAKDWVGDEGCADQCQVLPEGGVAFTRELANHLLPPSSPVSLTTLVRK